MKHIALALSLAGIVAASPATAQTEQQPTPDTFAESVNQSIVACFHQVLEPDDTARAEQRYLGTQGVTFSSEAPDPVRQLAAAGDLGNAVYTQWPANGGAIWVAAYTQNPACRVMIGDTQFAQSARVGIEQRLLGSGLWQKDEAASGESDGITRQLFYLSQPNTDNRIQLNISGPTAVNQNGSNLQMLITMAIIEG